MFDRSSSRQALRDLRAARRRRYAEQIDWLEALYRVYLGVIFGGWALLLISGALHDTHISHKTVEWISGHGPALMGLLAALAIAGGLRSGSRGGPLAIEAADVQHVLLAPVDRGLALRGVARRRLRTAVCVGAVVGVIVGNFALRRLPGPPAEWLAFAGLFGAVIPLLALATAMVASGRRLRPIAASLLAVLIVGWSAADFLLNTKTSPATMLGLLAVWPLHSAGDPFALPALALGAVAVTTFLALGWLAGTSLEAARRRAGLAAQLRFAVTLQDLRAVILLRRQLASETPRRRPWLQPTSSPRKRSAIWSRDWHSFLRWPAVRVGRVCILGALVGLALCAAWKGTTPLVAVAGLALLVAGFDAVEPLAQEVDHPTRRDLLPIDAARLVRRHLVAPTTLMAGVALVAVATALLVGARPGLVVEVGVPMVLPTAFLALCCAALSTTNDPYEYVFNPGIGLFQTFLPVALAMTGVGAPLLAAREATRHGHSAGGAAVSVELAVLLGCLAMTWWLGLRMAKRVSVRA